MHEAKRSRKLIKRLGISAYLILVIASCALDDPDDESEGGVIGTGLRLEGTVTDVRQFASNSLQIVSDSGEFSDAAIDDTGRYSAPSVKGEAPFLIRADLGNNEYRYAISFGEERANVHSYSDVILRNWFAANNGDIDTEYEQQSITTILPTRAQFEANSQAIFSLVSLVLNTYDLTGEQLLKGDYDSGNDPTGIDQYLRSNPVLIKDGRIAFVMTDPVTNTQSTTRSNFSIFELAEEPDTESPQIPSSVRALPSASDEIVVVWEPSIDNRGVVGYEIFRDDTLIATTPFPVYTDGGLEANVLYTYYITAIDGAGNTSVASVPSTTDTLGEMDNTPPPVPVQLTISSYPGQMELIWGQSDIGDVVGFDVYRTREGDSLEPLTTVTSTFMTDVTISSGVEYCYQISAVDASGNESSKSVVACQRAAGEEVTTVKESPSSSVPPLAGLNIPDIESMSCTNNWNDYSIGGELTIESGCYLVDQSIDVKSGGHLSLEPGTLLKFGPGTGISVQQGGSFSSIGTKNSPVVLTGQDATPGYWNGVAFNYTNSVKNKLTNTVVEYAGGGATAAAVLLLSTESRVSTLEISNSLITKCIGIGLSAKSEFDNLSKLDGSVISQCELPLQINVQAMHGITQRNDFSNNDIAMVELGYAFIGKDVQMKDLGVPYAADTIFAFMGHLTILEGVEIRFRASGNIIVASSLEAQGTPNRRIKFTGTAEERGHWAGIHSYGQLSLENVDLEYAGSAHPNSYLLGSLAIEGGTVKLESVTIRESSSYGINYSYGADLVLNNLSVLQNAKSIRLPISHIGSLGADSSISENELSSITLASTIDIISDVELIDLGVQYESEGIIRANDATLTLHEGVQLYMPPESAIQILGSSTLQVLGSPDAPVIISSISGIPGSWSGIEISGSSAQNLIQHASISFGGGGAQQTPGNIWMNCQYTSLSINNAELTDSLGWGIGLDYGQSCNIELGDNVKFARNRSGNISIEE